MIRFFGQEGALNEWREVVAKRVNKVVQPTSFKKDRYGIDFFADCELTEADRETLMKEWHGEGEDGIRWNFRLSYEEV
jgi:hypothetical protein